MTRLYSATGDDLFTGIAAHGIFEDMVTKAGGVNVAATHTNDKDYYANLSKEQLAALDVDTLVALTYDGSAPAEQFADTVFALFPDWPAAKNRSFVELADGSYIGVANAGAIEKLAKVLHP